MHGVVMPTSVVAHLCHANGLGLHGGPASYRLRSCPLPWRLCTSQSSLEPSCHQACICCTTGSTFVLCMQQPLPCLPVPASAPVLQVVESAVSAVQHLRSLGCTDIEFSPEDASRSDINFLYRILGEVIKAGATTINIPDTTGQHAWCAVFRANPC